MFDLVWPSLNSLIFFLLLKLAMWLRFWVGLSLKKPFNFIRGFFFEPFFSRMNVTVLTSYFFLLLGTNPSSSFLKCIFVPKMAFRFSFPYVKDSRLFYFSWIFFCSFSTVLWNSLFTLFIATNFSLVIFVFYWYFCILIFNSSMTINIYFFSFQIEDDFIIFFMLN